MSTLYRDYRPQDFQQVFGQNHIKITIKNEIISGRIGGAYLFCGPRAVGKTTLARIFAKTVNCEQRLVTEAEPCNSCPSCISSSEGKNLDIIEIDAASNTGVDHVRENIIASARLAPNGHRYKVFIIDEVHMLSGAAWNALLKIMEEPPAHILFILCTTEIHKVPLTIVSRCERFDFKRISLADTVEKLSRIVKKEGIEVEVGVLESIAQQSGGHLRDAESLLGQIIAISGKKIDQEKAELVLPKNNSREVLELIDYLNRKDSAKALRLVNRLLDGGVNIKNFITEAVEMIRKLLLNKVSPGLAENVGLDFGENLEFKINELQERLSLEEIIRFAERLNYLASEQKNSLIIQLPLELAIIELCLSSDKITAKTANINSQIKNNANSTSEIQKDDAPATNEKPIILSDAKNLSSEVIEQKWVEFLIKIKHLNHSLSFVMQNCKPEEVKDGVLMLAFKYKLHRDRVAQADIKILIENTLQEVYGANLKIDSRLDDSLIITPRDTSGTVEPEIKKTENNDTGGNAFINNFLQTLGGEIIS